MPTDHPSEPQRKHRGPSFKRRDLEILVAIHEREQMLNLAQIARMAFGSYRSARRRMTQLWKRGYVTRPSHKERLGLDEMPYWLAKKGAQEVAAAYRIPFEDFSFKPPRRSMFEHDFAVNDFRLDVEEAVAASGDVELAGVWTTSRDFAADYDRIEYTNEQKVKAKRGVVPDGFFVVRDPEYSFPFLLEIDRASEHNPRFGREKVLPGIGYLKSAAYQNRFGYESGRYLIVTTGEERLENLKQQTENIIKRAYGQKDLKKLAKLFLFTTFDQVGVDTVVTETIWYPGGFDEAVSLLERI